MDAENRVREILLTNNWQENLNSWSFREKIIQIKNFSTPEITRWIEYSIEETFDGQIILHTRKEHLGDLYIQVNYENPLPKLLMRSLESPLKYYELQAYNKFTEDQKSIIENRLKKLKKAFELKENEVIQKLIKEGPQEKNKHARVQEYESRLNQIDWEIGRLVTIVQTTINVASNFEAYLENISTDITKVEDQINSFELP